MLDVSKHAFRGGKKIQYIADDYRNAWLDIEGAEYQVLRRMLELPAARPGDGAASVACTFAAMHIEWHPLGNVSSARRAESAAARKRLTSELRRCGVSLK